MDLGAEASTSVSVQTVHRTIIDISFWTRRFTRVLLLTAQIFTPHLGLLTPQWTLDDWKHDAWSNESYFQSFRADEREWVRRNPHKSMDTACQQELFNLEKSLFWYVRSAVGVIWYLWYVLKHLWLVTGTGMLRLVVYVLSDHLYRFLSIVYSDELGKMHQENLMRQFIRSQLLLIGFKNDRLILGTSIVYLNPQRGTLFNLSGVFCND